MRLRCPKENCPINVPDELLGTTIRCPLCMSLIVVDARDRDRSAEQFKPGDPSVTPESEAAKKEAPDLENRIYDGLPPLSVMIALRKRQGANYDASDFARRYEMTDDDWKALDAFESVLYAVAALRISTVVGIVVLLINLAQVFLANDTPMQSERGWHPAMNVFMLAGLAACMFTQFQGAAALGRVQVDWYYEMLIPAMMVAVLLFLISAGMNGYLMYHGLSPKTSFVSFIGLLFNSIALFEMGRSFLHARTALRQIAPPEISHRLSEALRYLD
jgi:hypothetical protein